MKELLRTNDPTIIAFASALLDGEGIDAFPLDVHMSVLEGSLGVLPRRLMVRDQDYDRASRAMRDNGISVAEPGLTARGVGSARLQAAACAQPGRSSTVR